MSVAGTEHSPRVIWRYEEDTNSAVAVLCGGIRVGGRCVRNPSDQKYRRPRPRRKKKEWPFSAVGQSPCYTVDGKVRNKRKKARMTPTSSDAEDPARRGTRRRRRGERIFQTSKSVKHLTTTYIGVHIQKAGQTIEKVADTSANLKGMYIRLTHGGFEAPGGCCSGAPEADS